MPKKWTEVAQSEQFQQLGPDERDQARQQYFQDVVAPNVPGEERDKAWEQFKADTDSHVRVSERKGLPDQEDESGVGLRDLMSPTAPVTAGAKLAEQVTDRLGLTTPDKEESGVGTIESMLGSFARGVGQVASSFPKDIALSDKREAHRALQHIENIREQGLGPDDLYVVKDPGDTSANIAREYKDASPEEREKILDRLKGDAGSDPTQSYLYQAGEAIDEWVAENAPTDPDKAEGFWTGKVPRGMGSMVGFLGATLATRRPLVGAGLRPGVASSAGAAGAGASVEAVAGFEDALDQGASIEDAYRSSDLHRVLGTSEALPIAGILNRVDRASGGTIRSSIKHMLTEGSEEAIQEAGQTIFSNLIASDIVKYDPDRGVWEGAGEGAGVGFTTGGILSFLGSLVAGRRGADFDTGQRQADSQRRDRGAEATQDEETLEAERRAEEARHRKEDARRRGIRAPQEQGESEQTDAESVDFVDPRLKRQQYRDGALKMVDELVPGGGVFQFNEQDAREMKERGIPVSPEKEQGHRTPSVNPKWAQDVLADTGMSVKQLQNAVRKAARGERLGVRQQDAVRRVLDQATQERADPVYVDQRRQEMERARELRRKARAPRLASDEDLAQATRDMPEYADEDIAAGQMYEEAEYEPDWDGEARSLYELATEARQIDEDAAVSILEKDAPDAEVARQLHELIAQGRSDERQAESAGEGEEGRGRGPSTDATQTEPRGDAEAEGRSGLRLAAQSQPRDTEPGQDVEPDEDLFGERPVSEQRLADARRQVDQRLSPEGEQPPAGQDEGLFSGRQQQTDIEDAAGERRRDVDLRDAVERNTAEMTEAEKDVALEALREDRKQARVAGSGEAIQGVRNIIDYSEREARGDLKSNQAFLDADNFKRVNDEYGHPAGDSIIRRMGEIVAKHVSEGDAFHRSGDEFLAQADDPQALDRALQAAQDEFRQAEFDVVMPDGSTETITGLGFSYGIGTDAESAEQAQQQDKERRREAGLRTERKSDAGPMGQGELPEGRSDRRDARRGRDDSVRRTRGEVEQSPETPGVRLNEGETATTASGRTTTPFPKVDTSTERKAQNTMKRVDAWLQQNAVDEAEARGDDFNAQQFRDETPGKIPQASKDAMNEYLFGAQPEAQAPVTRPLDESANEAATSPENEIPEPSEGQKQAGNYRKGKVRLHGLEITIENPRGSVRSGMAPDGTPWESRLAHHYGYINRTTGKDGDHVDVFLGRHEDSERVFVIDQVDPKTREFDEHKVMMGFNSPTAAREGYQANYDRGWRGLGNMTEMSVDQFKQWLENGSQRRAVAGSRWDPQRAQSKTSDRSVPEPLASMGFKRIPGPSTEWALTRKTDDGHEHRFNVRAFGDPKVYRVNETVSFPGTSITGTPAQERGRGDSPGAAADIVRDRLRDLGIEEEADAGEVRADQGQLPEEGVQRGEGEGAGRADVQQATQEGAEAGQREAPVTLYRGERPGGVRFDPGGQGVGQFWTLDREMAERFADPGGQVREARLKPDAKRLKIVEFLGKDGDITDTELVESGLQEIERILGKDVANRLRGSFDTESVLTRKHYEAIREAGYDIVAGSNIEGTTDYVLNPDALEEVQSRETRTTERGEMLYSRRVDRDTVDEGRAEIDDGRRDRAEDRGGPGARGAGADQRGAGEEVAGRSVGGVPRVGWDRATRVVSVRGQPRRVFRGASRPASESTFQADRLGGATGHPTSGLGVWFTSEQAEAARYGTTVEPFYLDIRRPKVYKAGDFPQFDSVEEATRFRERLREKGYDGIAIDYREVGGPVHFVAFDAQQAIYPDSTRFQRDAVSFSERSQGVKPGGRRISAEEVQGVVDGFLNEYPGADMRVRVEATQNEAFGRSSRRLGKLKGGYNPATGEVILVAENLRGASDVLETLRHEIVAHHGMRKLFGQDFDALLDELIASTNPRVRALFDEVRRDYPDVDARELADEVLARAAEKQVRPSIIKRILGEIRRLLRQIGLVRGPISLSEIEALLARSADRLRRPSDRGVQSTGPMEPAFSRQDRAGSDRTPWGDFPDVKIAMPGERIRQHPEYEAAKGGDMQAAVRLVEDLLGADAVDSIRQALGNRSPLVVPVSAAEESGNNKIPHAFALVLADRLGLETEGRIVQSIRAHHTNASAFHRIGIQPVFDGPVESGREYLIVDDALTMGSTLANLRGHIEANGGNVVLASALTGYPTGNKLPIQPKMLQQLRDKHGDALEQYWQEEFGFGLDRLTQGEAGHLRKAPSVDAIRDRIAEARERAGVGRRSPDAADQEVTPPYRFSRRRQDEVLDEAMRRAGLSRGRRTMRERFDTLREMTWERAKEQLRIIRDWSQFGAFDRYHGIKRAEERILGGLPAEQSGYVAARLSTGMSTVMRGILHYGAPQWQDGILQRAEDTKGLLQILDPVKGDLDAFLGWRVGRRAQRLMQQGREHNFDPEHIDALLSLAEGRERQFEEVAAELDDFNRRVLDVAEEAGLIDAKTRPAWEQADYIPFYRLSEGGDITGPQGKQGLTGQSSGIRTLKGGEEALNDPLENMIMNVSHLLDASMKNHAVLQTQRNFETSGIFEPAQPQFRPEFVSKSEIKKFLREQGVDPEMIGSEAFAGMQRMMARKPPTEPDVIRVMEGGKPKYYHVHDPLLLRSLTAIRDPRLSHPILTAARGFKRVLTRGVTLDPSFMARNFMRDMLHNWTVAESSYRLGVDSLRGVTRTLTESGGTIDMMFAGGSFLGGYVNGNDPGAQARATRAALREKGYSAAAQDEFLASIVDTPLRWFEAYTQIGDAIENASREAIYEAAIREGKSKAQAVFEAKDIMDYSMQGNWAIMQVLSDVLPFFNARVQGLYRLGRGAAKNPSQMAARGSMIALATLALLWWNKDDERYKQLEEWDKDTYYHLFFPSGVGIPEWAQHIRIPKPFEVGVIFSTLPERWAMNMLEMDDNEKSFERFLHALGQTFAFNPVPQVFRPGVEVWGNWDMFTDRPIENLSDRGKLPEARYDESTSETMRKIGEFISNPTNLSPKELEHLWRGYLGQTGMYLLELSDLAVRGLQDKPPRPARRIDQYPVVKSFLRDKPAWGTKYQTELYELYTEVEEIYRTIREYRKQDQPEKAQELLEKHRDMVRARGVLQSGVDELRTIRRKINRIYRDEDMSPEAKRREIDRLLERRNEASRETVQRYEERVE